MGKIQSSKGEVCEVLCVFFQFQFDEWITSRFVASNLVNYLGDPIQISVLVANKMSDLWRNVQINNMCSRERFIGWDFD